MLSPKESTAHIMVIDDSSSVVDVLNRILSNRGYRVTSCGDGKSGWKRLLKSAEENAIPDLLLLDLMLPLLNGLDLLRRIRSDNRFSRMPVIILTVRDETEVRLEALEAGANDYLTKPFVTVELITRVGNILAWKMAERSQRRKMKLLVKAGQMLLSTIDIEKVLQYVMNIAMDGLEAEGASVWIRVSDGSLICWAVSGIYADQLMGWKMPPGKGIAGWALQHKKSVLIPDASTDPRFYQDVSKKTGFHNRDIIAVPLLVRDQSIGVLEAVNKKQGAFSSTDLAWMEVLAPMAAASITNARLFKTLQQRTTELKEHNQELDAFAHTVAHDLRNPLSYILGYADVMVDDYQTLTDEEIQKHLQAIVRTSYRMDNIIDELLLLAQVRKMDAELEPLNMEEVVSKALERLAYFIEKQSVEIKKPDEWPKALGYGPWVEEVWLNYIHNAIKYGGNPPRVELGVNQLTEDQVCFWVRDNGLGLTKEEQAQLFTPFKRLKQVRSKGHGLGLSIVRRIVEKLNGQVGVQSDEGRGSTFYFILPSA